MTKKGVQRETAILVASDMHYGKSTPTFDTHVFRRRMEVLGDRLVRIRELMSGYQFDELVIVILGDANDGTGIYPTQEHHQEVSDVEDQAISLANILADFATRQAREWGQVRVEPVVGNHGRAGRFAHEAANWDYTAYRYLQFLTPQDNVKSVLPGKAEMFLRVMNVYQHGYLLYHGHAIRTYGQIPWYGIQSRLLRWAATSAIAPWQVSLMGRFHTSGVWRFNDIKAVCTGTMVSDDEWALQTFGWDSANEWLLFGASPKYKMTWQFALSLME